MMRTRLRLPTLLALVVLAGVGNVPALAALTDNGDGTVTDTATGLMWAKCSWGQSGNTDCSGTVGGYYGASTYTWQQALALAVTANTNSYKGHNDWRLPNISELESIVKIDAAGPAIDAIPAIDAAALPRTVPGWYWSSTPFKGGPTNAWVVGFSDGLTSAYDESQPNFVRVRLVRSGQSFDGLAPTAPLQPSITAGNGQAWVTFTPPSNGGSAITGYTASCTPIGEGTAGAAAAAIFISRLRNDVTSSCEIRATNAVGAGAPLVVNVTTHATALGLNDTGGNLCFDLAGGLFACSNANTGNAASYGRQDGRFGRDAAATAGVLTKIGGGNAGFDFTKLRADGNPLAIQNVAWSDNGSEDAGSKWSCVRDNVTGLVWLVETSSGDWAYATETYPVSINNSGGRCGFASGWWLPTDDELASIVDYGLAAAPTIDTSYFPGNYVGSAADFWTASSSGGTTAHSWSFASGVLATGTVKLSSAPSVRLVHPGVWSGTARFVDNGDGTVSDGATGLIWAKCPVGLSGTDCATGTAQSVTWSQALGAAASANANLPPYLGYSDWRLPNVRELQSLVDATRLYPSIDPVFPATPLLFFWSATDYAFPPSGAWFAWFVYFYNGYADATYQTVKFSVRLVRSGQSFGAFDLLAPRAPTIGTPTTGNGNVTVNFTPAVSGSAATTYTASCTDGSTTRGVIGAAPSTSIAVDQLTNGVAYTCSVTAANSEGSSLASTTVNATPHAPTAPDAPSLLRLIPGDHSMKVIFSASVSNGGSAISGYVATCTDGTNTYTSSPPSLTSPITVTGLTKNVSYACRVHANNGIGSSSESPPLDKVAKRTPNIAPLLGIILGN